MESPPLTRFERRALSLATAGVRGGEGSGYGEMYTEKSAFALTLWMYEKMLKKCETMRRTEVKWVERGGARYAVFTLAHSVNGELRMLLQAAAAHARRTARLKRAEGHHLTEHYRVLWEIQKGRCYFSGDQLGERFEDRKFSVDHLTPIATRTGPWAGVPGSNWPTNLALVTRRVNSMKGGDDAGLFIWRLKHEPTRYSPAFTPTPQRERVRIDRIRRIRFAAYMQEHCPGWEHP